MMKKIVLHKEFFDFFHYEGMLCRYSTEHIRNSSGRLTTCGSLGMFYQHDEALSHNREPSNDSLTIFSPDRSVLNFLIRETTENPLCGILLKKTNDCMERV